MSIVIAERYYERRFPGATAVLNYPDLEQSATLQAIERQPAMRPERIRLLYVGSSTTSRGALLHAELASKLPGCEIMMSGFCSSSLAEEIRLRSGDATLGLIAPDGSVRWEKRSGRPQHETSTLILEGVGFFVPPKDMIKHFRQTWTAGIAIFPRTDHYYEKELTKFFEYMAAGLPIVCSDFPTWRALVEASGCGFTVDPADWDAIIGAIRRLHESPERAVAMGLAGRKAVQERYNWKSQADNLLGLYARVLGRLTASATSSGVTTAGSPTPPERPRLPAKTPGTTDPRHL
jgi:glycosyltransferase involved in cell wall biosynthesis